MSESDSNFRSRSARIEVLHQLSPDSVALIAGHHANLSRVAHAFGHGRSQHHGNEPVAHRGPHQERSFRQKLSTARKQHDVAQEFHSARFGAVLVVDFAVHVVGVRKLNELRGGIETRDPSRVRCAARWMRAFR